MSTDYIELMTELEQTRAELGERLSKRQLASQLGISQATVAKWLAGDSFPEKSQDKVYDLVAAIRREAKRQQRLTPQLLALTDPEIWKAAYRREAHLRAGNTSIAMKRVSAQRALANALPGQPIGRYDPLDLGVHQAIHTGVAGLDELPHFVRRAHDVDLPARVAAGGVVALVGDSSSGKSRSAWEAVRVLSETWRLWRPGDWSDLYQIAPYTVIWLDDAHEHLTEAHAEQLAALLNDSKRSPITVLATMWRTDWMALTADRSVDEPDPHRRARRLLRSGEVYVPCTFKALNPTDLAVASNSDPRIAQAVELAGADITQYLAGVPALLKVYGHGSVMTRALITAAVDARRLGMAEALPLDFLAEAAPGYPREAEWQAVSDDDWLAGALAEASKPVRGIAGPLSPLKLRTRRPGPPTSYRLAPYLEQLGRDEREEELPPSSFWEAARQFSAPSEWAGLALQADSYGLHRIGAKLRKAAVAAGYPAQPIELLQRVPKAGADVERWLVETLPITDPWQVHELGTELAARGARELRTELYRRAAGTVELSSAGIVFLVKDLAELNDATATATFVAREPGRWLPTAAGMVRPLTELSRQAGVVLADRIMTAQPEKVPWAISDLVQAGFAETVRSHVAAVQATLDPGRLMVLLGVLHNNGFDDEVAHIIDLHDPVRLASNLDDAVTVLRILLDHGREEQVSAVVDAVNSAAGSRRWHRTHADLMKELPMALRGRLQLYPDPPQPSPTCAEPRARIRMGYMSVTARVDKLAEEFRGMSPEDALAEIAEADLTDLLDVLTLLRAWPADTHADIRNALVQRIDPARLPIAEMMLCAIATELGPGIVARAIMVRVIADYNSWYGGFGRRRVLSTLQAIEADDLLRGFAKQIADAGNFAALRDFAPAEAARFPYGREPDGEPSAPWGWSDLQ